MRNYCTIIKQLALIVNDRDVGVRIIALVLIENKHIFFELRKNVIQFPILIMNGGF